MNSNKCLPNFQLDRNQKSLCAKYVIVYRISYTNILTKFFNKFVAQYRSLQFKTPSLRRCLQRKENSNASFASRLSRQHGGKIMRISTHGIIVLYIRTM